jgi:hypothetical protein
MDGQHSPEFRRHEAVVFVRKDVAGADNLAPGHARDQSAGLVADACGGLADRLKVPSEGRLVEAPGAECGFIEALELGQGLAAEGDDVLGTQSVLGPGWRVLRGIAEDRGRDDAPEVSW